MELKEIKYIDRESKEIKKEKVPGEKYLKFLYCSPFGKIALFMLIKRKILSEIYGRYMSSKFSIKKIDPFIEKYDIDMKNTEKKSFMSFNDFFKRKNLNLNIDNNRNTIISPVEGKVLVFDKISELKNFFVKGEEFRILNYLNNKELAEKYRNGVMMIFRLAPSDYHRFHFPISGYISESKRIEGKYYSVSPIAVKKDFLIFCKNKREYSLLKTDRIGEIIISEVGATMVGKITQTYKEDSYVEKGEEKGYFEFGGSTCVLFFEPGKITVDEDIKNNSKNGLETRVKLGETIGKIK